MELLDSDDDMKRNLLRKSAQHREEIEGQVKLLTENTERIITNALVIGGTLALTYFVARQFMSGSKKKRKVKTRKIKLVNSEVPSEVEVATEDASSPGVLSQIGSVLAGQASAILLNLAKEKLTEFMQTQAEKKDKE